MDLKVRQEYYDVKKEPEDLFNDSWFFGNSLRRRDGNNNRPSPNAAGSFHSEQPSTPSSSNAGGHHQEASEGKSYEETYESIKKLSGRVNDGSRRRDVLVKAPSMPCSSEIVEEGQQHTLLARGRGGLKRSSKLSSKKKVPSSNLARAPSLPISLRDHEDFEDDEEIEFSMGRLIRLASMNSSDSSLPPRTTTYAAAKGAKAELESIKSDSFEDITTPQCISAAPNSKNDIAQTNTNPNASGDNSPTLVRERNIRRWNSREHSSDLPIPAIRGGKRSSSDTKEQIKFWARSVASNVRQEC